MYIESSAFPGGCEVRETPEQYAEVTKPYIENIPAARIHWVYNILTRKVRTPFHWASPCRDLMFWLFWSALHTVGLHHVGNQCFGCFVPHSTPLGFTM